MSQHSQRTQRGPSVGSIIGMGAFTLTALTLSILTVWRPERPDTWHTVGAAGWTVLAWVLTAQTVTRCHERQAAIDRARRAARSEHEARQLARLNTGTWQGDAVGQVLTVRYDPADGRWYVQGWMGDHAVFYPERHWGDRDTLYAALAELEVTGELEGQDDEGTRAVRARLGLPGPWFDAEPVQPLGAVGDETRRLEVPPGAYGPSAAALRPIAVPVFRTEADRALWAAEHDMPTDVFPIQRDA